jgi:O-antigen/teichoic acid export membrane protein
VRARLSGAPSGARRSVASASALLLGGQAAGNAGYLAAVLVLARALPPPSRGAVAFLTVSALTTAHLATLGSGQVAQVFAARRPETRRALLASLLALAGGGALVGSCLVCGALLLLGDVRPSGIEAPELALLALGTLAVALVLVGASFLQGCSRFGPYTAVLEVSPWLYAALLALVWATAGLTVRRAAGVWVLAEALPAAALCVLCVRGTGLGRPSAQLLREAIPFGVRACVGGLAHFLNARVDQLVLGLLAGGHALGLYAVAVNASEVLYYLPTAVATALLPAVAAQHGPAQTDRALRAFRTIAAATIVAVLVAAVVGPVLLPLLFGHRYGGAVEPFLWLLPSALGYAASAVFSSALLATSAPSLSSLGPAVALGAGVALDLLLIPAHGAAGAAAAASGALLAGGAAATVAFAMRARVRPRELLPRLDDVASLCAAGRRVLRSQAPALRSARRTGASPS